MRVLGRSVVSWCLSLTLAAVCGCGDSAGTGGSGGAGEGAGGSPSSSVGEPSSGGGRAEAGAGGAAQVGAGGAGGEAAAGGSGAGGATGAGGEGPAGLADVGTLVVLGDSIGDGGGQSPFYYTLLRQSLEGKYGPIAYHRNAESGSKTGALVGQIGELPSQLPGPVVVTITSGGNDMKAALPLILAGADGAARAQMGQNIDAALDALLEPGRFGPGVEVHVFEATIYDASDGAGDFGANDCAFGQGLPAIPTDAFFDAWNGEIAARVTSHGQVLADLHDHFDGHGYDGNPSWYASDCTHPNSLGHAEIAGLLHEAITGEPAP